MIETILYFVQLLMCLSLLGAAIYSIKSEKVRNKQLNEFMDRLKNRDKDEG